MFCKLALRNVHRSVKDYSLYFLTLLFGVCVFYVFNSLENQWVMEALHTNERGVNYTGAILQLVDVVSVFVAVVLAFLILYANSFLLRRRKKELGTYLLLGMEHSRIALLLSLETLVIGLAALVCGLVLGFFLAQALSAFTAALFRIRVEQFYFVFSWKGVGKTILYFGIIFLLVMVLNVVTVARQKLIRLLQANRQNQSLKLQSLWASVVFFLLGAVLLGIAYTLLLRRGLLTIDRIFALMLALGTLGTLLFFRSLSGFLLRLGQSNKKLYYRELNMFVLRQFNSRITTHYLSMTVVCLLLLLAIGITACSVGVNNTVESNVGRDAPVDMTLRVEDYEYENFSEELPGYLAEAGFDPESELTAYASVTRYVVDFPLAQPVTVQGEVYENRVMEYAMSLSDYNALMAIQDKGPYTLEPGTYGVVEGTEEYQTAHLFWGAGAQFVLDGVTYSPDPDFHTSGAYFTSDIRLSSLFIFPDGFLESLPKDQYAFCQYFLAGNYAGDADAAEDALWACINNLHNVIAQHQEMQSSSLSLTTYLSLYAESMGTKLLVLFLGLYLGIIFLVTSAAVLALQQLSQAADNVERYRILSRLGVEERMRDRSSDIQVFLAFFLPLVLAVVHSIVGMKAANDIIAQLGKLDTVASSAVTALFILVVYGLYFLATCWSSRRILRDL